MKYSLPYILLPILAAGAAVAAELHVSPKGSDSNPGTPEKPFASIEKARDTVRALKAAKPGDPVTVWLHGGTYTLSKPLLLTPEDSGTQEAPVSYRAAKGETPVLSSARPITGWKKHDEHIFVADIPKGWRFHFLYAEGKSMPVSSLHKSTNFHDWPRVTRIGPVEPGGQLLGLPPGQLDGLPDNGDMEMNLIPVQWWNTLSVVRSIDPKANTIRRHSKSPTVCDIKDQLICHGGSYNLLNALKFITEPGEWAVDSTAGKVYFRSPAGMKEPRDMFAPSLYRLIEIKGDPYGKTPVHDIEIRGLTLTCTDRLPEDQWPDAWVKRQAELPDGMLSIEGATRCVIDSCVFTYSGSYAVSFQNFAQHNRITRNEMGYLGCGGVLLQGFGPGTTDVSKHNIVQRNHIHHTGNGGFMHSAAVTLYQSNNNDISLNLLEHLPYAAIQITGCHTKEFGPGRECLIWDSYGNNEAIYKTRFEELPKGRDTVFTRETIKNYMHSGNNRIARNIVAHYMEKLGDGGALYCWGCGLGNVWDGNVLVRNTTRPGEILCVALYMDDEVDGATLTNNICWHMGYGNINKGANKWENNIVQATKPAGLDQRITGILAEAANQGGLPGTHTVESIVATPPDPVVKLAAVPITPGQWVEAAAVRELRGPRLDDKKQFIGWIAGGHSAVFGPYQLDPKQVRSIEVEAGVDPGFPGGKIIVRTSRDGPDLAVFDLKSTGGFEQFKALTLPITLAAGNQPLYFFFEGGQAVCSFKRFRLLAQ